MSGSYSYKDVEWAQEEGKEQSRAGIKSWGANIQSQLPSSNYMFTEQHSDYNLAVHIVCLSVI